MEIGRMIDLVMRLRRREANGKILCEYILGKP